MAEGVCTMDCLETGRGRVAHAQEAGVWEYWHQLEGRVGEGVRLTGRHCTSKGSDNVFGGNGLFDCDQYCACVDGRLLLLPLGGLLAGRATHPPNISLLSLPFPCHPVAPPAIASHIVPAAARKYTPIECVRATALCIGLLCSQGR